MRNSHFVVIIILHSCLKADERNRWSASQLLVHSFITPAISSSLPNGHQDAIRNNGVVGNDGPSFLVDEPEHEEPVPDFSFFSGVPGKSRVKCDFEELQFLGKGGFGNVIKVGAFSVVTKQTKTNSNQAKRLKEKPKTARDRIRFKYCQRRIYKRSDQPKKCKKMYKAPHQKLVLGNVYILPH